MTMRTMLAILAVAAAAGAGRAQTPRAAITILYDAFGRTSELERDWGFAALVEYGGRRVLFDTGNNAEIFERNVDRLGVDLTRLDAAVISHRHGDHTSGLPPLLRRNPTVKIYVPQEGAMFGGGVPDAFLTPQPDLPAHLRYFGGTPPARRRSGSPWTGSFEPVTRTTEILPGFYVLTTQSHKPGTMEMNEVSLAIRTPRGLAVVVGCSHPGVEKILEQAARIDPKLYLVTGGFHLVMTPKEEVQRVATTLRDTLKVERVAPGHCTSELGFSVFLEQFTNRFDASGLGATLALP